jgi:hypothetical protein
MTRPDPSLQQQASVRTALRVGAAILLGIGLVLTAAGLVSFFGSFNDPAQGMPRNFWMAFVGLPLVAIGGSLVRAGYLGPASRYVAGEVTPTIRDTIGALGIGQAEQVCAACGHHNDADSRFCNACGKPLGRTCPSCGAENDPNARFCDGCGQPLPA